MVERIHAAPCNRYFVVIFRAVYLGRILCFTSILGCFGAGSSSLDFVLKQRKCNEAALIISASSVIK